MNRALVGVGLWVWACLCFALGLVAAWECRTVGALASAAAGLWAVLCASVVLGALDPRGVRHG